MAHSCPECGQVCYCGGDIDDCCFEGTPEERACQHCPFEGGDDDPDDDYPADVDDDDPVCACGRAWAGEACGQCGAALCPMCFETGAGFCSKHPDEHYRPPEEP